MKLKPNMVVTVKLDDEELQFRIVPTGGDGKESLSLEAPLARLLGGMTIGDTLKWQPQVRGAEPMRVELVKVEEAVGWLDRTGGET